MSNEPVPPDQVDPGGADQNAERLWHRAEEARATGERHRTTAEALRQERESLREGAEMRGALNEEGRVAADSERDEVVESMRATVESLKATLERMVAVEEMRRMLREVSDGDKPESH